MSVGKDALARAGPDTAPGICVASGPRAHEVQQSSMAMSPLCVGDVIAEKYRLISLLGRGSMGEVWLAHHQSLRENVAIKLLAHALTAASGEDASRAATRLRFEAQVAARLSRRTRHIVQVTDHGEVGSLAYLVMEPLEGVTLETRLMQCEWLPLSTVQVIVRQVARALEHAHAERVLHRDLKPSNLFLTKDEDGGLLVKVLDFGIARTIHRESSIAPFSTGAGVVCGTPGYMSPEQARGQTWLDARCDLWALATIAYEALTNELPVSGCSPDELYRSAWMGATIPIGHRRSDIPAAVEAFFERALAEDIAHRFATAQELVRGFDDACAEGAPAASSTILSHTLPSRSSPPPSMQRGWQGVSAHHRSRRLLTALAFVPLVVALGIEVGLQSRAHLRASQVALAPSSIPAAEPRERPEWIAQRDLAVPTVESPTEDLAPSPRTKQSGATAAGLPRPSRGAPPASGLPPLWGPTDHAASSPTGRPTPSAVHTAVVRDRSDVL